MINVGAIVNLVTEVETAQFANVLIYVQAMGSVTTVCANAIQDIMVWIAPMGPILPHDQ